jgi:hypothetical protein
MRDNGTRISTLGRLFSGASQSLLGWYFKGATARYTGTCVHVHCPLYTPPSVSVPVFLGCDAQDTLESIFVDGGTLPATFPFILGE